MIPQLSEENTDRFPPADQALQHPNGLLAWGGDLSVPRLVAAYRRGIFPWFGEGEPILWWSPAPRCVLRPGSIHVSRRFRRTLKQRDWSIHGDEAFDAVMKGCADREDTWITEAMFDAYQNLHRAGVAHSVEVRRRNRLVGGLYGLALGRMFFAESMFFAETDMSKVALLALARGLEAAGFTAIDCQVSNPHLLRMGAEEISRDAFEMLLENCDEPDPISDWADYFGSESAWSIVW